MRKRGLDFRGGRKVKASVSPVPYLMLIYVVFCQGLRHTPKTSTIYYYGRFKNIIKRQFE